MISIFLVEIRLFMGDFLAVREICWVLFGRGLPCQVKVEFLCEDISIFWALYRRWCIDKVIWRLTLPSRRWLTSCFAYGSQEVCLFLPSRATDLCFQPMDLHVIRSSLRSFAIERPSGPLSPSSWDLDLVPRLLMSVAYESFVSQSMLALDVLILRIR